MSMPPLIAMTRTQHEALEHALDHLRRSASAAGCVPGECQHVARRLRAEIAILERLMELALVREASGADSLHPVGGPWRTRALRG